MRQVAANSVVGYASASPLVVYSPCNGAISKATGCRWKSLKVQTVTLCSYGTGLILVDILHRQTNSGITGKQYLYEEYLVL
jgi:hypothetical protein